MKIYEVQLNKEYFFISEGLVHKAKVTKINAKMVTLHFNIKRYPRSIYETEVEAYEFIITSLNKSIRNFEMAKCFKDVKSLRTTLNRIYDEYPDYFV